MSGSARLYSNDASVAAPESLREVITPNGAGHEILDQRYVTGTGVGWQIFRISDF